MSWMNLILLLILIAGHAEICATFINRSHSLPIHQDRLKKERHLIDLLIASMPFVILIYPGWISPGLLRSGHWSDLNLYWKIYFTICAFGSLGGLISIIRWHFYRVPAIQDHNHTEVINIAKELKSRPVNRGHYSWMTSIPGNQIFEVEFSEHQYEMPINLKPNEELRILHLTDFHFTGILDLPFYEKVIDHLKEMNPDLIVFTGDLIDDPELIEWIPKTLGQLKAPLGCYFILGNHDWYYVPDQTREALKEIGWIDLGSRVIKFRFQNTFLELGGLELPWMGSYPEFDEVKENCFRILLSHSPDYYDWAQEQKVDLMLSGHNHGGQVVLPIIGPVFAPSLYGVRYASGVFYRSGTLMSVLRGLSGVHPLRWNCRPEVVQYKIVSSLKQDG